MRIQKLFTRWVTLLVALLWMQGTFSRAIADSWGPPQPEHWSANKQFVLRVDHTKRRLTLQERGKGPARTLWSIRYPQTGAPQTAYITDDGRYVVLQDQHGSLGSGKVFVFLGPSGVILKSYTLEELLTQSEILHALQTISSTWWSVNGQFFFTANQSWFACVTQRGTIRCFDLATGNRLDSAVDVKQRVRDEAILRARNWLHSSDNDHRTTGVVQVGALGDRDSRSMLASLLDYHSHPGGKQEEEEDRHIQYCAAGALVALLKEQAAPLLEAHLDKLAPNWTSGWLELYMKTSKARLSPKIRLLTQSHNDEIRESAIKAFLDGGNPKAVRQNRAWLTDRDKEVRFQAILNLSMYGSKEDLPLLRIGLRDKDDSCEFWALRGLIRLNAPELPNLLQHYLHARNASWASQEAQLELARRGDKTQLKRLVTWVRSLHNHTHDHQGWGTEEMDAVGVCEILAAQRPPGAVPALRAAAENPCVNIQRPALGALAVMGEANALLRIRQFAQHGEALQRADAVHWLALSKDHASEPFLQAALLDEDVLVRNAATEALKTLASGNAQRR